MAQNSQGSCAPIQPCCALNFGKHPPKSADFFKRITPRP
jgi:hypothetical protein